MMPALSLESFDAAADADVHDKATFQEGFDAGFAEGQAVAEADQTRLTAALAQSVADIAFGYAEARAEVIHSLSPLISTLMERILPMAVADSFALQGISLIESAAVSTINGPLSMTVHPDQHAALAAALADTHPDILVQADPSLSKHAVCVCHLGSGVQKDMDALVQEIGQILKSALTQAERAESHG